MDLKEIQGICKDLEKKSGKGSIFLTGKNTTLRIPRWSTKIEALDDLIGGGNAKWKDN